MTYNFQKNSAAHSYNQRKIKAKKLMTLRALNVQHIIAPIGSFAKLLETISKRHS